MTDPFDPPPRHGTPGTFTRFSEWLLRREALARARAAPPLVEPARTLVERAREAANAGATLLEAARSDSLVPTGGGTAYLAPSAAATAALRLYGEAAYWALRALVVHATGSEPAARAKRHDADASTHTAADELTRVFAEAPAERLLEAAGSTAALAAAQAALSRTFEQASTLSEQEREAELVQAQSFVDALLRTLDARNALVPRLLGQRYGRLLGSIVGFVLALVSARYGAQQASRYLRPDLAPSASWRVSTTELGFEASGRGFLPPEGGPNVFFQTLIEDSPWIEFDLGAPRAVRGVSVNNRLNCCQDYAVPLVVELSDDAKQWTEVARREQRFYTWTEWFPESQARYLRLRVARRTLLHLGSIEIR
jgi:hypothetical protein